MKTPKVFNELAIKRGETLSVEGDCVFKCEIPEGVTITVTDGEAQFDAQINSDVTIQSKSSKANNVSDGSVVGGSFNSVTIYGRSNRVIVNGQDITSQVSSSRAPGAGVIKVNAPIMNNVTLNADAQVEVTSSSVGQNFTAEAGASIQVKAVGQHARLDAGASVNFDTLGDYSIVSAGASIKGEMVAKNCELDAGASIKIKKDVYDYSSLDAGASIQVGRAFKNTSYDAGASISADFADPSASFDAGVRTQIGKKMPLSVGTVTITAPVERNTSKGKVVNLFKGRK
jgi:NDP-sugar pyrophosphorylase family protein